ncbi:MAG: sugar O-acetyltransferase [Ruminococcus sp.]|nr:sugar O-acetyltransferase [Ruminococcus sp.]
MADKQQFSWEKELHEGEIYDPNIEDMMDEQMKHVELLYDFNQTRPSQMEKRKELMQKMFGDIGEGCYIEPPFYANWGGRHVHLGNFIYANFGLTCVDDTHIYIGDHTMLGPNVTIATANHPLLPELREKAYQYNLPVHIGRNCWFGAGVIVVPGVTIGDNTVIGAGSIVTKDIPSNCLAVGNPCRVLRELNEHDREYYYRDRKINWDALK